MKEDYNISRVMLHFPVPAPPSTPIPIRILQPVDSDLAWNAWEGVRDRLIMPAVFVPFQRVGNFLLSIGKVYRISET